MPRTKAAPKTARRSLSIVDAGELFELLENQYPETDSTYRTFYARARATALKEEKSADLAGLIDQVDGAAGVEYATRRAGFLLGFEICRRLLLGELDVQALKGGAR
jgi:hypothetical protein